MDKMLNKVNFYCWSKNLEKIESLKEGEETLSDVVNRIIENYE